MYRILDEQGNEIQFKMNAVQKALYWAMWWLNIIPKSRQHGITTFICLFFLDACLFNNNVRAGIIAHKLDDAKKIFRDKIKFAYDHLPGDLKAARRLIKDDAQALILNNNSAIYVGTSMRSGTLQYLHVSEYGWICTHTPIKAVEIKTGAMETVHQGNIIFIESTAEGPVGDFPDMCRDAEKAATRELGPMDYKLHFFPWHAKATNVTEPRFVEISGNLHAYFDKLEQIFSKKIKQPQRAWYTAKKKILRHLIYKEHPSTLEEAFIAAVEGAYFAQEMAQMREENRICHVAHQPRYPVHTVCDLGVGGNMPWIFFQVVGLEVHIPKCFNLSKKDDVRGGMAFYKSMLDDMKDKHHYNYGKYFCPFDINKGEIGTGRAIYDTARSHGLNFVKLDRELSVLDGIERLTNLFPRLYIDVGCEELIMSLSSYRREWLESADMFSPQPLAKQKASHYADAARYLSKVIEDGLYKIEDEGVTAAQICEWSEKYRRVS